MSAATKRELFALGAMQALLSNPKLAEEIKKQGQGWIVLSSIAWADDLIKALESTPPGAA